MVLKKRSYYHRLGWVFLIIFGIGFHVPGSSADPAEKAKLCITCHGESGLPNDASIPIISGQEFYYLYVQLKDYKAGRRANPIMQGIVANLVKEDMRELAQYFSEQTWPATGFRAEEAFAKKGEKATIAGQCVQCHLGGYEGDSRVPRLAGQQIKYLERTMQEFKTKVRLNSPAKNSLLGAYEECDITAMAHFISDL